MIRNPEHSVTDGYDIHVVFHKDQQENAHLLFKDFCAFLSSKEIPHKRAKIFDTPVGPWPTPMWQAILPKSERVYSDIGHCISWFMLNRRHFSVMIHPNTKEENGMGGNKEDHMQNMLWMGPSTPLKM